MEEDYISLSSLTPSSSNKSVKSSREALEEDVQSLKKELNKTGPVGKLNVKQLITWSLGLELSIQGTVRDIGILSGSNRDGKPQITQQASARNTDNGGGGEGWKQGLSNFGHVVKITMCVAKFLMKEKAELSRAGMTGIWCMVSMYGFVGFKEGHLKV
ncbi:hypothetical protein C7212DRAFT_366744 [Tuber magnatum]|uniref:Uncharacterized protein n=1 Tax=Tuber magnatum TaxID=42249 RepID=A0A317SF39_9PEZI|nr:hypothetical protein C7212DRAFT_366744 [Tuber magnatum]